MFNIINPTLFILVSLLLVSTLFMRHVLKVTTALHSSVSLGCSLTWSWSMFDYLIKNWTSQSNCLLVSWKSHLYGGGFVLILNLNAFNCPYFIHFSYWLTSASKINRQVKFFRQVFKTFIFFVSTTRKEPLSRGKFNFKLRNLSCISALFDYWQISFLELRRSVLVVKLNHFVILMKDQ